MSMTREQLAAIRERDAYFDKVTVGQLTGDRRALLAEVDELQAQVQDLASLLERAAAESAGLEVGSFREAAEAANVEPYEGYWDDLRRLAGPSR